MRNQIGKLDNFELVLNDGDFPSFQRRLVGVPWKLTKLQRKEYVPYLNVNDERGLLGTLQVKQLRQLRSWLNRVNL